LPENSTDKATEKSELMPQSTKKITMGALYTLLRQKAPEGQIFLSDREYKLCHINDITAFLVHSVVDRGKYVADRFDCDDFSFRLMGEFSVPGWAELAFGIVWTNKHAFNCFVNEDKRLQFVEPQNDKVYSHLPEWMGTKIRLIVM